MNEEKKDEVLLNVSKSESNVNVSIANSVLSWLSDIMKVGSKDGGK